jgi:hypothetical protein
MTVYTGMKVMFYEKHHLPETNEYDFFLGTRKVGTTTLIKE